MRLDGLPAQTGVPYSLLHPTCPRRWRTGVGSPGPDADDKGQSVRTRRHGGEKLYYAAHAVVDISTENANNDSKRNELETLPNRDTHEGIANARAALLRPAAQASCAAFKHQPDDVARPRPASELDTLQWPGETNR